MSHSQPFAELVSTAWLAANQQHPEVLVFDCSMAKVVGKEPLLYDQLTVIRGAQQLHLEVDLVDHSAELPNTFPSANQVTEVLQRLGVNQHSQLVLYDNQGIYSAPRAWVILKAMGLSHVAVLDGGLPQWLAEQRPTTTDYAAPRRQGNAVAHYDPSWLVSKAEVEASMHQATVGIVDARSAERFYGRKPEPRADMRSGHIPGSCNLPFTELMQGYRFAAPEQLAEQFATLGLDHKQRLLFSCGSGITACILLLAAQRAGIAARLQLYDGSWAEFGRI